MIVAVRDDRLDSHTMLCFVPSLSAGRGLLPLRQTGVGVMSWQAKKYRDYASECVRLAQQADSIEKRNKLLELARVWADAAVVEDQLAAEASTSKFTYRWA